MLVDFIIAGGLNYDALAPGGGEGEGDTVPRKDLKENSCWADQRRSQTWSLGGAKLVKGPMPWCTQKQKQKIHGIGPPFSIGGLERAKLTHKKYK